MTKWDGSKLMKIREARLWSRGELASYWAKKYGKELSLVSISNWERGIKPPGRNNLLRLAGIFDVSIEYFFSTVQRRKSPKKPAKKRFRIF
jgi:transcriptional regulator with XRE-family HTH domain